MCKDKEFFSIYQYYLLFFRNKQNNLTLTPFSFDLNRLFDKNKSNYLHMC